MVLYLVRAVAVLLLVAEAVMLWGCIETKMYSLAGAYFIVGAVTMGALVELWA